MSTWRGTSAPLPAFLSDHGERNPSDVSDKIGKLRRHVRIVRSPPGRSFYNAEAVIIPDLTAVSLARQIGGDVEQHSSEGWTSISVTFPVVG